jgi:tetratricopeptide (TPR) repeat protein
MDRGRRHRAFSLCFALALTALAPEFGAAAQTAAPRAQSRKTTTPDPATVERQLLDAVHRNANSFAAHHRLAAFYLQQGKLRAAIPHLERARAIDPSHDDVAYDLARALMETGRVDDARAQVRRLLNVKPTGELHNLLGDVEERAGNLAAAAEEYQRAADMDPNEEHLFDWGNNRLQLQAFEPATEVFKAAVVRHPRSARLRVGLGIALYSQGQYRDAVEAFCDAADLAPSDPRPYQFLGEMYGVSPEVSGEITERLARFVKAHPRNALAHFHYAMSLWKASPAAPQAQDAVRIEALLRRAVALDSRLARGFLQLGILLDEQQRYAEAIRELQRATRLQPDLSQAHYRLSQLYRRTGQKDLAAKELEIFRQLTKASRESR